MGRAITLGARPMSDVDDPPTGGGAQRKRFTMKSLNEMVDETSGRVAPPPEADEASDPAVEEQAEAAAAPVSLVESGPAARRRLLDEMRGGPARTAPRPEPRVSSGGPRRRGAAPGAAAPTEDELPSRADTSADAAPIAASPPPAAATLPLDEAEVPAAPPVAPRAEPEDDAPAAALKADQPSADELKADQPSADEPPADQSSADELKADQPPADELKADQPPADEPPADQPPVEEPATAQRAVDPASPEVAPTVDDPRSDRVAAAQPAAASEPSAGPGEGAGPDPEASREAGSAAPAPSAVDEAEGSADAPAVDPAPEVAAPPAVDPNRPASPLDEVASPPSRRGRGQGTRVAADDGAPRPASPLDDVPPPNVSGNGSDWPLARQMLNREVADGGRMSSPSDVGGLVLALAKSLPAASAVSVVRVDEEVELVSNSIDPTIDPATLVASFSDVVRVLGTKRPGLADGPLGDVTDLVISTINADLILRPLGPDYYLLVVEDRRNTHADLQATRLRMAAMAPGLAATLAHDDGRA